MSAEELDYTLQISKAVLERYALGYVKKMYRSDKGVKVELAYDKHFEDKELSENDGTKGLKWALLDEPMACTLRVVLDTEEMDISNLVEPVHSDIMDDIGLKIEGAEAMKAEDNPRYLTFSTGANNIKNLARNMRINPRDLQTALLEMHDSGMDGYKAVTLNHGASERGRR